ncbi:MAG: hypothetical protein ABI696_13155, partial [Rubrivivax sp.]
MDTSAGRTRRRCVRQGARGLRAVFALVAALLAFGGTAGAADDGAAASVQRLDRAIVSNADPAAPHAGSDPLPLATPLTLPDHWAGGRRVTARAQWYRLGFERPATGTPSAVYIERVCSDFGLRLNGHTLRRPTPAGAPATRLCGRPQLLTLPDALLLPGANVLDLQVLGEPLEHVATRRDAGGLSALEVGPGDVLERRHALATGLRVQLPL